LISEAPGLSSDVDRPVAVVGMRCGSLVRVGLSRRELTNIAIRDLCDDFTSLLGDHCYPCRSSRAGFLLPRVCQLDDKIDGIRINIKDTDELLDQLLKAARGGSLAVDSVSRLTFVAIWAAHWNSELFELVCGQLSDHYAM
jgi:hypothetical protein